MLVWCAIARCYTAIYSQRTPQWTTQWTTHRTTQWTTHWTAHWTTYWTTYAAFAVMTRSISEIGPYQVLPIVWVPYGIGENGARDPRCMVGNRMAYRSSVHSNRDCLRAPNGPLNSACYLTITLNYSELSESGMPFNLLSSSLYSSYDHSMLNIIQWIGFWTFSE